MIIGHPYEPMLAVSGMDYTVKIFSADRRAQHDARHGINIGLQRAGSDLSGLPIGLGLPGRRFFRLERNQIGQPERSFTQAPFATATDESNRGGVTRGKPGDDDDDDDEDDIKNCPPTNNGLASRRRIHQSKEIMAQNEKNRLEGLHNAHLAVCSSYSEFIITPLTTEPIFLHCSIRFQVFFFILIFYILFRSLVEDDG